MTRRLRPGPWLLLPALAAWVFWLRWDTFAFAFWNLDEGIYATVGRTVLEGGVMYRDAIDHRAPVCHYLTAAVFAVAGTNNVWAMHAALAAQITATAFAAFLLGRRWRGTVAGVGAALALVAFATDLSYVGDAYALSTEWCLAFFSAWGAWWFWRNWPDAGFWSPALAGAAYALAFMSKQPGLLELGAPLLLLAYLGATRRLTWLQAARVGGGLITGFGAVLALIFGYFWVNRALADFYFYGWTYNLVYYGFGVTPAERALAALALPNALRLAYPLMLAAVGLAAVGCLHQLTRDRPSADEERERPAALFLLAWLLLSAAGSASAGRIHPHYYIQSYPALALAAGWFLGGVARRALAPDARRAVRVLAVLVLAAAGWNLVSHPIRGRARPGFAPDAAIPPATFVAELTRPTDRIFVWGLYPDFYVHAGRAPASRYIYTSFQTGVQPGRNTTPDEDTSDDSVPGATSALVAELARTLPVAFVDSSVGPQRLYEKYPLWRFPALDAFVRTHYAEANPLQFRPTGFRVLLLKDSGRTAPAALAGGAPDGRLGEPVLAGPLVTDPAVREYDVYAVHGGERLQRLELIVNGTEIQGVTFPPRRELNVRFLVDFGRLGPGRHRIECRATTAAGEVRPSAPLVVECAPAGLPPEEMRAFALPLQGRGPQLGRIRAPYGASAREEAGALIFAVHAPSSLSYPVPAGINRIRGAFGFRPGAYAPDLPMPTDGAEFAIVWIAPSGERRDLLRRLLRPASEPADRGEHAFDLHLPAGHAGGTLELSVSEGPAGNASHDWTYWSELELLPVR